MAKQARDGGSIESSFDFSKFLDLDDDDLSVNPEEDEYQTIPHTRDEVVTGALGLDLDGAVEGYIKAGKVSWGDKRSLKRLTAENRELEIALAETDEALLERTVTYHTIVSDYLREKDGLGRYNLDDSDPYDSQSKGSESKPLGSAEAREKSSEIFREIEKLEVHRNELNGDRTVALEEIMESASKLENGGWEPLDAVLDEKLSAIRKIQPITRVQFSEEDEAVFEQGVGELTGYIDGSFDPLADEDEYSEEEETPLSSDGHSEEELLAMERAGAESTDRNFAELFGADSSDEFSSEESAAELHEALGEGYVEMADSSDETGLSDEDEALGSYGDLDGDLSAPVEEFDGYGAEHENYAETGTWYTEGGPANSAGDELEANYIDFSQYDLSQIKVKTVIFDELRAQYGISFEGVPGLED